MTDDELLALVENTPGVVELRERIEQVATAIRDPCPPPPPSSPPPRSEGEAERAILREAARHAGAVAGAEDAVVLAMQDPALQSADVTADGPSLDERIRHAQRTLPRAFKPKPNGHAKHRAGGFDPTA